MELQGADATGRGALLQPPATSALGPEPGLGAQDVELKSVGAAAAREEVPDTIAVAEVDSGLGPDVLSDASPSETRRVKQVKIAAGAAIDRVEFEYSDSKKWSMGGAGGNKGIPPLVLAPDEYLTEVQHEALPQWWYVGSSIEFRTNKGRRFRHVAGWGSGRDEDMRVFHARPGQCIMSLRLRDGFLEGIVEGPCHVSEDQGLDMYMVYWLEFGVGSTNSAPQEVKCPKGHAMRQDWSRAGHICDECSRAGTMARCGGGCDYDLCDICFRHHAEGWGSSVQKRGFEYRDAALRFAAMHGAGPPAQLAIGPIRVELEDHPWLDAFRELTSACRGGLQSLRTLARQALGLQGRHRPSINHSAQAREVEEGTRTSSSSSLRRTMRGPLLAGGSSFAGEPEAEGASPDDEVAFAGLVVDVEKGTRVRAWGPTTRLSMCEKAAADAGEFNPGLWERRSSSLKGWVEWARRMGPLLLRILSLLNWREEFLGSMTVGLCVVLRSVCDGWQPVLTGAVFNLINGDKQEVDKESRFLHFLCSWSFGCEGRLPLAKSVILGLMLAAFVQGLANAASHGIKDVMRQRQSAKLRTAMFEHLLAQDVALYDTRRKRDLAGKAELKVMDQITEWLWSLAADIIKLSTQLVFLFAISPLMTVTYVVLLPLLDRTTRHYLESGVRAQQRQENGLESVRSYVVHESVSMIRTVKTFSREDRHVALVALAAGGMLEAGPDAAARKLLRRLHRGAATVFNDVCQKAVYCFCLWTGLVWMERDFSAGDMTAYLLLIQQVGGLGERVRHHFRELQRRHDVLQAHFEFMDRIPAVGPGAHTAEVQGLVQFEDVHFSYPARPDALVLKGVSFEMEQGKMTALVGASGSGKSTVAALLFRHYDPCSGNIMVDGTSMRSWDTNSLHAQMALVAQSPLLFDTSIRNNLTYGCRSDISDEEIFEAARMANAHDFILEFPAGYDTYVGDQGAHMSGGQKQRLSIARAVILQPRILCLDEATSALDAESEGIVQDALDVVMQGRTTLVIAHRLSTIKTAHQIVCMRDGRIVELGRPAELLAKHGYYWNLVKRQVCTLEEMEGFNLELDQKVVLSKGELTSPAEATGGIEPEQTTQPLVVSDFLKIMEDTEVVAPQEKRADEEWKEDESEKENSGTKAEGPSTPVLVEAPLAAQVDAAALPQQEEGQSLAV